MTNNTLIIGMGFIGKAHLESLRRLGIKVCGLVDPNEAHAKSLQEAWGIPTFTRWEDALEQLDVQVVHNCTPNHLHAPINAALLQRNIHVFSEKPLGISTTETAMQLKLAEASQVKHAVNFTYRGYPMVHELKSLIQSGELGKVQYVRGHYLQDWLLYREDYNWRLEAATEEARAVADIGSHLMDLTRYVLDLDPTRVYARFSTLYTERLKPSTRVEAFQSASGNFTPYAVHTEDQASLLMEYGDVKVNFEISQVAAGHQNDLFIEVLGTHGSARWSQENPEVIRLGYRGKPSAHILKSSIGNLGQQFAHYPGGHPEGYPDALSNVIRAFHGSIKGEVSLPHPTFLDGHVAAKAIEAAVASARTGNWMDLELISQVALPV